ncbi:MAG: colanic acid biosynthesis protein WcaH [Oleiphilaceae bacterium]|jgi:colanic acid biosynthesis protein WcaH
MHLPISTFKTIIEYAPLISIDLVVHDKQGKILLGYRNNRPAQGYWFVPGGRIQKDESMSSAFRRLTMNELGEEFYLEQAELIGPFEHFYTDNVTGDNFSTHYIALGYRLVIDEKQLNLPTEQHSKYTWMTVDELLTHPQVHKHSRWYFEKK